MTTAAGGRRAQVVGVAGVGMSAVAQALRDQGWAVSGSDRYRDGGQDLDVLRRLERAGVRLVPQDGSGVAAGLDAVVVSTAIEADNPDLAAARRHGVEVVHRAEMIARLAQGRRVIAITGTSGKTTTTGLVGHLLEQLGHDPTVVNGGVVLNWRAEDRVGNVRAGRSDLWVVEADESDRSLLRFHPDWAVITNVSKDHFELEEVTALFRQFMAQTRRGVVGGPGAEAALPLDPPAEPFAPRLAGGRWTFAYRGREFVAPMIGRHNAENVFTAVRLCERLGLDLDAVRDALPGFRGIHRRLETAGAAGGVTVIDDYAHNPAKLAASWAAAAESAPRVLGFWRPHGYGPLQLMQAELADAFAAALRPQDRLFILPVYYAGGTANKTCTSEQFVSRLAPRAPVEFAADYDALRARLRQLARPGDVLLGMGARDPRLPEFAAELVRDLAGS